MRRPEVDEIKSAFMSRVHEDPSSHKEAMKFLEANFYQGVVKQALDSIECNIVWDSVEKPRSKQQKQKINLIDSIKVFKKKTDYLGKAT